MSLFALAVAALLAADSGPPGPTTAANPGTPPSAAPSQSQMPRTGQATLSWRVPVYPRAKTPVVPIGDQLEAHGMPMNIQSFYTDDDPPRVLGWYKAFFADWQLPMLGDGDLSVKFANPSITVIDMLNGVDFHVICVPGDGNGKVLVLLAMADIRTFEDNVGKATELQQWGGLPPYPNAEHPMAVASNDAEVRTISVSFASHDSPGKILEHYTSELGKQGYRVQAPQDDTGQLHEVELAQGSHAWHFAVSAKRGDQTTVLATWTSHPEVTP